MPCLSASNAGILRDFFSGPVFLISFVFPATGHSCCFRQSLILYLITLAKQGYDLVEREGRTTETNNIPHRHCVAFLLSPW